MVHVSQVDLMAYATKVEMIYMVNVGTETRANIWGHGF